MLFLFLKEFFYAKPLEDGDHFVLRVDRLLTESLLKAVIECVKKFTNSENEEIVTDVSPDRMDLSNESLPKKLTQCKICHDEDEDSNIYGGTMFELWQLKELRCPSYAKDIVEGQTEVIRDQLGLILMGLSTWMGIEEVICIHDIQAKQDVKKVDYLSHEYIRNEDLRTELEYFSEDYDEEREMEPRPEPNREATSTFRPRSLVVRRQRERVVGFEEAPNREGSRRGRNAEGISPSEIKAKEDENMGPMYAPSNMTVYPNHAGSFADSIGSVTLFVRWIEDYPLPNGLKMPSHIGSYDGKEDPDNFLHLFEGAIRMKKWLMPVACHMFTYTLKDSARIWWNSQKTGSILNNEDLKAKFQSHFSQQKKFTRTHLAVHNIKQREGKNLPPSYKGLIEKTYTWIEAREVATNGTPNSRRDNFERSRKSSWDNKQGQKGRDRFSPYRGTNHELLSNLSRSSREILAIEKATRSFELPPRMFGSR
nr:reverse transcriptase domain-containing protein [Tanacetum cinerariifolium]